MPQVTSSWWQGRTGWGQAWLGRALVLALACAGMTTACSGSQPPSGTQTPSSAGASTPGGSPTSATATPPSATTQTPTPTQTSGETPEGGTGPEATTDPPAVLGAAELTAGAATGTSGIGSFHGAGANRVFTGGSGRDGFTRSSHTPRPPV